MRGIEHAKCALDTQRRLGEALKVVDYCRCGRFGDFTENFGHEGKIATTSVDQATRVEGYSKVLEALILFHQNLLGRVIIANYFLKLPIISSERLMAMINNPL